MDIRWMEMFAHFSWISHTLFVNTLIFRSNEQFYVPNRQLSKYKRLHIILHKINYSCKFMHNLQECMDYQGDNIIWAP